MAALQSKRTKELIEASKSPSGHHYLFLNSLRSPLLQRDSIHPRRAQVTPTRFWRWLNEDEFERETEVIASGNFGQVKKAKLKPKDEYTQRRMTSPYAGRQVALKEPKGSEHNFVEQTYALSHEVSCTVILHPSLINYIGGVDLGTATTQDPQRLGIVMEFVEGNLRKLIESDPRLENRIVKLKIARQIASGINFLHSLNPYVLHRDLRTPNILVDVQTLECKIADFGISKNMSYGEFKPIAMYANLIPPECEPDKLNFTKKGDIYFYGWVLVELLLGKAPGCYNFDLVKDKISELLDENNPKEKTFKQLIYDCLQRDPTQRPEFKEIHSILNSLLDIRFDNELIAQNNEMELLKEGIRDYLISPQLVDLLGRKLIHQCCIFGNFEMLKYLTSVWGVEMLKVCDKYRTSLTHLAARNGYIQILEFLQSKKSLFCEKELRFLTTPLDLAVAMKHYECVDFLISHSNQETLDSALLSASAEGQLEIVKQLIAYGANLECRSTDIGATPLDRAAYNGHLNVVLYLLEKGATVNQARPNGVTPLYLACQNKHKRVVEAFIKHSANVNQSGNNDVSPLFIASQKGHSEIVEILLKRGAFPNFARNDDGTTPLFIASQNGHTKVVQLLLQYGANVNQTATDTQSPLTISSYRGHTEIVALLLQHGADTNKRAFGIYSALDNARNNNFEPIVHLLLAHEKKILQKKT